MEATQFAKNFIDFQKRFITSSVDATKLFQNQTQATMENILKQTAEIPVMFQKTFTIWADATQKNVESLVATMKSSAKS